MLLLTATTDKLDLVTSAAASVHVHASYIDMTQADPPVVKGTTSGRNHPAAITTATTTDIVPAPAATTTRNVKTLHIRNTHASVATDVTVRFNQNATTFELWKANLAPGEALEYIEGIGFFEVNAAFTSGVTTNKSLAAQGAGFAADTYLTGSNVPLGTAVIGTTYILWFDVVKTAAGVATPIITIRVGTAGTTADTARCTLTFGAGTAAIDTGVFEVHATFRSIGSGTSAVLQGSGGVDCGTGIVGSANAKGAQNTSSGFDSTVANSIIGVSFNGGTSFAGTVQLVNAEIRPY